MANEKGKGKGKDGKGKGKGKGPGEKPDGSELARSGNFSIELCGCRKMLKNDPFLDILLSKVVARKSLSFSI